MLARLTRNNADSSGVVRKNVKLAWRSLTWQLIFVTILPLTILVLIVAIGSLTIHQNAMRNLVGERDGRSVRTAAAALEEQVSHKVFAIRSLSLLVDGADSQKTAKILSSSNYLLTEFDSGLAFFNPDGTLVGALGDRSLWDGQASAITSIIQTLSKNSDPPTYLSSAFTHPVSSEPVVLVLAVSPARNWVAAGAFSANSMVRPTLTNAFSSGPQASVVVLDADKHLVYESGTFSDTGEVSNHPGIAEALRGESGADYVMVGKSEHVVAYSPIAPLGWALVLEEPWAMVASPTLRASQMAPFILVPVLILAVVALGFGARQIVEPLQTLESRAATLAWGDFKTIETSVGGIEEIRHLQAELINMARKVQAAQQSLHGYIGAITAAQEEERRRLARELHDETIQALIALKQRVQITRINLRSNQTSDATDSPTLSSGLTLETPQRKQLDLSGLDEIALLTEQTIENLRRLTRDLRPIYLEDLGLVTALEMLARETGQTQNIKFDFHLIGIETRLAPDVELAFYRIAQESVSNISRHAQASEASLHIIFTALDVKLEISDNGKGFEVPKNPAEFAPSGHYGLLGLHERAELIGSILELHSSPGHGTHVSVMLPISANYSFYKAN